MVFVALENRQRQPKRGPLKPNNGLAADGIWEGILNETSVRRKSKRCEGGTGEGGKGEGDFLTASTGKRTVTNRQRSRARFVFCCFSNNREGLGKV